MRNLVRTEEICRLPLSLMLVILLLKSASAGPLVASLSQYDPEWPLDARTAYLFITDTENPTVFSTVRWTGEYYRGTSVPVGSFHFRVYADVDGMPGGIVSDCPVADVSAESVEGQRYSYSGQIPSVNIPGGSRVWLEVQETSPAVPQWGIVSFDAPETDGICVFRSATFGIDRWTAPPWLANKEEEAQPLNDDGVSSPTVTAERHHALCVQPNPTTGHLVLRYSLTSPGHVRAVLYDIEGRPVRSLVNRYHLAGNHELSWDDRETAGPDLPRGVYFVRMWVGTELIADQKIVVVPQGNE